MTHLSPAVFGMWSACCVLLTAFCLYHLWHYDRFKCLRINSGPYSGTFKRVMTYTYILTLPLVTIYSVGNAVIKYQEGFVVNSEGGVFPKSHDQWTKAHQNAIFPLIMLWSIGSSLEIVTHLEELCFWMFLMNATASSQNWFRSTYFSIWSCGSVIVLIYFPTVSAISRHDPLKNEAYTFLAEGIVDLVMTLFFIPILYSFPAFMRNLVKQGIDKATIIRLNKFHELNRLRIFFRLLFVVPLVILGIDGTKPHSHPLNESMFWTDIFGMVSGFGCVVSSAITLLIFFPRNDDSEYESSDLARLSHLERSQLKSGHHHRRETLEYSERNHSELASESSSIPHIDIQRLSFASRLEMGDEYGAPPRYHSPSVRDNELDDSGDKAAEALTSSLSTVSGILLRPNRLGPNGDVESGSVQELPPTGAWVSNWTSQFKSPLDVMQPCAY